MWLFLDSSERGFARVALLGLRIAVRTVRGKGRIVHALAALIPRDRLSLVQGVCVVAGPGPFSAVRSGVLAGNVLARMLHVPLYRVLRDEAADLSQIRDGLRQGRLKRVSYVAPLYDAEPNITCHP